jgi:hypothetical protein
MKLWRLRKQGRLHSLQIGGKGSAQLTCEEEIARIEQRPQLKTGEAA